MKQNQLERKRTRSSCSSRTRRVSLIAISSATASTVSSVSFAGVGLSTTSTWSQPPPQQTVSSDPAAAAGGQDSEESASNIGAQGSGHLIDIDHNRAHASSVGDARPTKGKWKLAPLQDKHEEIQASTFPSIVTELVQVFETFPSIMTELVQIFEKR